MSWWFVHSSSLRRECRLPRWGSPWKTRRRPSTARWTDSGQQTGPRPPCIGAGAERPTRDVGLRAQSNCGALARGRCGGHLGRRLTGFLVGFLVTRHFLPFFLHFTIMRPLFKIHEVFFRRNAYFTERNAGCGYGIVSPIDDVASTQPRYKQLPFCTTSMYLQSQSMLPCSSLLSPPCLVARPTVCSSTCTVLTTHSHHYRRLIEKPNPDTLMFN
jgi:hypothetical protein